MNTKTKYRKRAKEFLRKCTFSRDENTFSVENPSRQEKYTFIRQFYKDSYTERWVVTGEAGANMDLKLWLLALEYVIEDCKNRCLSIFDIIFESEDVQAHLAHNPSFQELLTSFGGQFTEETVAQFIVPDPFVSRLDFLKQLEETAASVERGTSLLKWKDSIMETHLSNFSSESAFHYYDVVWKGYDARVAIDYKNGSFGITEVSNYIPGGNVEMDRTPLTNDGKEAFHTFLKATEEKMVMVNLLHPPVNFLKRLLIEHFYVPLARETKAENLLEAFLEKGFTWEEVEKEANRLLHKRRSSYITEFNPPAANLQRSLRALGGTPYTFSFLGHAVAYYVDRRSVGEAVVHFHVAKTKTEADEHHLTCIEQHTQSANGRETT